MPIRKLPEADIRSICASQALSSPVFVVKELVENALDAGAKSITIEIAANTIDVIRVTDDGYGVPPEDRELLAQRHCTSKLSSFLELESLGGRSYGFRGAALASLAELSASLYITTKVEGEVVATTYHLNPDGSIAGTKVASHAVGTTVRAVDLLDRLPVRREQMVKQADRTIAAITGLLGAYAFCRSETRVRFKVLKEQNSKRSWCYTPEPMATLKQIASQIIGAEAASQLQESQAELPLLEEGDNLDPDHPVEHISVRMLSILGHSGLYLSIA